MSTDQNRAPIHDRVAHWIMTMLLGVGGVYFMAQHDWDTGSPRQERSTQVHELSRSEENCDIDQVPTWYVGMKPWRSLSTDVRRSVLGTRAEYEARLRVAKLPSVRRIDPKIASRGEQIVAGVVELFALDPMYREAIPRGRRMAVWFPEEAWTDLAEKDRTAVRAWLWDKFANWEIGVGRIDDVDPRYLLAERIVEVSGLIESPARPK